MADFEKHTRETAPDASAELFHLTEEKFGMTPNLVRYLSESPEAARGYLSVGDLFEKTSLSPVEQQVVLLTVSFENRCDYCMAAHSAVANMVAAPEPVVEALRDGSELPDERLNALSRLTRTIVRERGRVSDEALESFLDAGFERRNVLEVLLGVTMKTLSNYTNHIVGTEVDEAFQDFAWVHPSEREPEPATT